MASHDSWLPASFEFLSGLPSDARKRRLIVTFQAFIDDSGGVGHSKHFVLAGLIGASAAWAEFSDEWRACLAEKPAIKIFKMREAAIRAICQHREPEAAQILPVEPLFRTDDEFLPLQAADLVAWCIRRSTDDPTYSEFNWLLEEMTSLQGTDYSQYYDRERMESVWSQTEEILRGGTLPASVTKAYRETFGE